MMLQHTLVKIAVLLAKLVVVLQHALVVLMENVITNLKIKNN